MNRKRWTYWRVDVRKHAQEHLETQEEMTVLEFFHLLNNWNRLASIHPEIRWMYYTVVVG